MARECPNRQKKKEKVLAVTCDDSDSEREPNNDKSDSDDDNFIAFTASICSHDSDNKVADDEIENESQCGNSEEISNLQDAYDRLYQVSTNWAGENYKLKKKLDLLIKDKEKLNGELNSAVEKIHSCEKALENLSSEYKILMGIN